MAIDADDIKRKTDIATVVSHYVPLKKSGIHYIGLCPFHADKSPSFYVTPSKGVAHCFGCGVHQDVIDFIMEVENLDYVRACERLAGTKTWTARVSTPTAPNVVSLPLRVTSRPPHDAPTPSLQTADSGEPVRIFPLKDLDGSLLGYEARYQTVKALMWTWGAVPGRKPRWACAAFNEPRPLYGLHRLGEMPEAPILITEGPKKADAAHRLWGTRYACLSLTGGINAMPKHDYQHIANRAVLLWPDADNQVFKREKDAAKHGMKVGEVIPYAYQPGPAGMFALADKLVQLGCQVQILNVAGMPDGWDVADAEEEGWTDQTTWAWASKRIKDYTDAMRPPPPGANPAGVNGHAILEADGSVSVTQNHYVGPYDELDPDSDEALLKQCNYMMASDVDMEPIRWLWPDRIALGKISLLVGNPGLGKSQTCASISAIVTKGGTWPGEAEPCEPGSVIILSSEDDPSDTVVPRLEAAGADRERILLLSGINDNPDGTPSDRAFSVKDDLKKLGALMNKLERGGPKCRLVIIDPISAYMGNADSYKDSEVRSLLTPLTTMAHERKFAILLISHLTKAPSASALLRVQGSVALTAQARAVWGVNEDPDNPARRLFISMKNNLGEGNTGLAFTIERAVIPSRHGLIKTSHVVWEEGAVTMTANEVMNANSGSSEEQEEAKDAQSFLRSMLADGEMPSNKIKKEAEGAGYKWHVIDRVKRKMGVMSYKKPGVNGPWMWWLKGHGPAPLNAYAERDNS